MQNSPQAGSVSRDRLVGIQKEFLRLHESHLAAHRAALQGRFEGNVFTYSASHAADRSMTHNGRRISRFEWECILCRQDEIAFWKTNGAAVEAGLAALGRNNIGVFDSFDDERLTARLGLMFDTILIAAPLAEYASEDNPSFAAKVLYVNDSICNVAKAPAELIEGLAIAFYPQHYGKETNSSVYTTNHAHAKDVALTAASQLFRLDQGTSMQAMMEEYQRRGPSGNLKSVDWTILEHYFGPGKMEFMNALPSGKRLIPDIGRFYQEIAARNLSAQHAAGIAGIMGVFAETHGLREWNTNRFNADAVYHMELNPLISFRNELVSRVAHDMGLASNNTSLALTLRHTLTWLPVTWNDLLSLRQTEDFRQVRALLSQSRESMNRVSAGEFSRQAGEFSRTLFARLDEHAEAIARKQAKQQSDRNKAYGAFAVGATIGVASLALPALTLLSVGSFAYGTIVGGPSIRDLVREHFARKDASSQMKRSSLSILASIKDRPR